MKKLTWTVLAILILTACEPLTPPPLIVVDLGTEFTLAPGQSASPADSTLTIKLVGVSRDQRCPFTLECAASGPVTLTISVQSGDGGPAEIVMQTFTDYNGRAPEGPFEGIQDRVEVAGYLIRVVGVLPFPQNSMSEIKAGDYRLAFIVTKQ